MSRQWSVEDEVTLFSLICDHKPVGPSADERIQIIVSDLNNSGSGNFTAPEVWAKLNLHFNMKEVEDIENESDSDRHTPEDRTFNNAEFTEAQADIYSSELSDVEGDVGEIARIKDEDEATKKTNTARGRRKSTTTKKKDSVAEEPAPRKRTRSVAKLGGTEPNIKRRQSRSSPSASTVKRRTRSELSPDPSTLPDKKAGEKPGEKAVEKTQEKTPEKELKEEAPNAGDETQMAQDDTKKEDDIPKTRRSTRQSVRRSVRKK